MEWRRNGVEDGRSINLMEESGDSEADSDPEKNIVTANGGGVMNYDVDDAESCSSESYYDHVLVDYDDDDELDDDDEICNDDDDKEQGEDHDDMQQQPPEAEEKYGNADESSEVMDAMEDRIFWETCLAVGFSSKP